MKNVLAIFLAFIVDFIGNKIIITNTETGKVHIITVEQSDIESGKVSDILKKVARETKNSL